MALVVQASLSDVEQRMARPLTPEEQALASARLADAAAILEAEFPTLNDRLLSGALAEQTVIMVHADMVVRAVRNPEGIIQEVDGNYSRTLASSSVFAGGLEILPHERRLLSESRARVGSFRPYLPVPAWPLDVWRPW